MRLDFTIDIARPVRDAFAIVGDAANDPQWPSAVQQGIKVSTGPIGNGTRFRQQLRLVVRSTVLDIEFRDYVEHRRYVLGCTTGLLEFTTAVSFEQIAFGTGLASPIAGRPRAGSSWRRSCCRAIGARKRPLISRTSSNPRGPAAITSETRCALLRSNDANSGIRSLRGLAR
jgi:hypothetical protein